MDVPYCQSIVHLVKSLIALRRVAPLEALASGDGADLVPGLRLRAPQFKRTTCGCDECGRLATQILAVEDETADIVDDRIAQSADAVHDAGQSGAHREHLADAARLETGWHQEQVSEGVQGIGSASE